MGEGLQWFFSTIADLPGGLQWREGLQYNNGIKKFPVCLRTPFRTPKTVFALQKPLFAVRNLLFALHKMLSYSENYTIYFGNDFLHHKSQVFCSLKTVSCTIRSLAYMPRAAIHVDVKFPHPPCLNENMSSGERFLSAPKIGKIKFPANVKTSCPIPPQ